MACKSINILAIIAAILTVGLCCISQSNPRQEPPHLIGGECLYDAYNGKAFISGIRMTPASKAQKEITGGPGYEGYEVRFKFSTEENIKQQWAKDSLDREHLLQLANSWYPGKRFISKYAVEEGKIFNCRLKVITKGTCAPIIFEFPEIKLDDFFETKRVLDN